ncbi:polygalacturonase-like [Chenopodium quinoa]|uniref:polygalacturonase-like n=1 Tax=Chenopodium quinoa TaxID=63459 RepID=UPI000B799A5B|nr:polygalacturonase-like [Chenopodium quinoa]
MTRKSDALSLLLILLILSFSQAIKGVKFFNVKDYGALGDDHYDSSEAFERSWNEACKWKGKAVIKIPRGKFLLRNLLFQGPCMGPIDFHNAGFLKAHKVNIGLSYWVEFRYVDRLGISGSGHFDGQGSESWFKIMEDYPSTNNLPTSLMLTFVNNSRIDNMNFVNSKGSHIKLYGCKNVTITQIHISAPPNSPNTDGINIAFSRQIQVTDSKISTGDDCISLLPGAEDVNITDTRCGPGHGISIGSMGIGPNELAVKGINVKNCNFTDTMNGVRIKTWATKNAGKVAQISFESIFVNNASNPIIIDQNYCPSHDCPKGDSHVQISDVKFVNIMGVSQTYVAVNLQCSKYRPCEVETKNINLKYGSNKGPTISSCYNVKGVASGFQKPPSCIS